ncbi:tail length tape measure protein [Gordonia phage Trine]|uniref:Tape measure protein n=1 Tax=Gordonia phage Trine TaxID=2201431 RepID=A0A2Z4QAJ0_9CAUD|nr:tail length tape measure protein [Gordonia phage Trine]AWY06518.1 tape measure protein [Gordonia phage Trine]
MAAETNVGYASLQVIPTVAGISGNLSRQLGLPFQRAGQQAGRQAGEAIATGIEASAARVEGASEKLAKAREAETAAAAKVRIAEAQLQELRDKGVTGGSRWLRAEENLRQARSRSDTATRQAARAAEALEQAQRDAANATDDVTEATSEAGIGLDGLGERAKGAVDKLKTLALVGGGIGATLMAGITGSMSKEVINDKLAASLGASPALAKEYGDIAGRLYAGAYGESLEEVSAAVGVVASSFQTLGSEGEASLEQVTARALDFSQVFDSDVSDSVQTVSQLINQGLIKDSTEGFDLLTTAFQRVPAAMRDELPEILQEYGVNFNALGFTGEQAFNTLVIASQNGKFALDKTGDALKEFTIRGSDMSEASQAAFRSIGIDAQQAASAIAAGGAGAQKTLQETARGLLGIEDPAERANTAIALFGTPLEDLSVDQIPVFLESLAGGENAMEGFAGAADRMGDTVNDNGTVKLESLKRTLTTGLVSALENTATWLSNNVPLITNFGIAAGTAGVALAALAISSASMAAGGFLTFLKTAITSTRLWAAGQWVLNAAMNANPIGVVIAVVVALVGAIILAYKNSETFRNIVAAAWAGIKTAISAVWNWISTTVFPLFQAGLRALGAVVNWLWLNVIQPAWTGIKFAIEVAWFAIQVVFQIFQAGIQVLGSVVTWLWQNVIQPAWDGISTAIGFAWDTVISPIFGFFKSAIDTLGGVVEWLWKTIMVPAWDAIKGAIESVWNFIRPILDNIGKGIESLGTIAAKVGDAMRNAFDGVVDVLKAPIHAIGKLLASLPDKVMGIPIPGVSTIKSWGETLQSLRTGGVIAGRTAAGELYGPGTGTSDSLLGVDERGVPIVRVSKGEGVVKADVMANGGAQVVAALNAGKLPGLKTGGTIGEPYGLRSPSDPFPAWVTEIGREHGVQPSTYAGHQASNRNEAGYAPNPEGLIRGIDWTGSVEDMQKFAEWLLSVAPSNESLEQIIWQNPNTGQKIGWYGRTPDTDGSYYASDYGGHQDHVHTRHSSALLGDAAPVKPDTSTTVPGYESPDLTDTTTGSGTSGSGTSGSGTSGSTTTEPEKVRMKSFKELGSDLGGILAEGIGETLGLPSWIMDPQGYVDQNTDTGENVRTKVTNSTTNGQGAPSATTNSTTNGQGAPSANVPDAAPGFAPDTPETLEAGRRAGETKAPDGTKLKGMDAYVYWITKAAKDLGVGQHGAMIGNATALVESGDPMKMYANNKVPASLQFPHDAVGSDGTSVGLFQQQDNGAWGTVADRMDPYRSAKLFYTVLKGVNGWETMDPGAAAQAVQRSAFPDKYATKMSRATELVKNTKLFDTGGIWEPGTFGYNGLDEPELVVKRHQWGVMDRNAAVVEKLARSRDLSGGGTKLADVVNIQGYTAEEIAAEWRSYQWARNAGYGTSRNR